jgi:hypothetical protein
MVKLGAIEGHGHVLPQRWLRSIVPCPGLWARPAIQAEPRVGAERAEPQQVHFGHGHVVLPTVTLRRTRSCSAPSASGPLRVGSACTIIDSSRHVPGVPTIRQRRCPGRLLAPGGDCTKTIRACQGLFPTSLSTGTYTVLSAFPAFLSRFSAVYRAHGSLVGPCAAAGLYIPQHGQERTDGFLRHR